MEPLVAGKPCDALFDNGISQGFLAFEVAPLVTLVAARIVSMPALWKPDL
jgi:hypothetical protein